MSLGRDENPNGSRPAAIAPDDTRMIFIPASRRSARSPTSVARRSCSGSPEGPTREVLPTFTTTVSPGAALPLTPHHLVGALGLEIESGVADPDLVSGHRPGGLEETLEAHPDEATLHPQDRLLVIEIGHRNRSFRSRSRDPPSVFLTRDLDGLGSNDRAHVSGSGGSFLARVG